MRLNEYVSSACIIAAICVLVVPLVVGAQACVGRPGPESGRLQLGAGYASTPDVSQASLSVGGVGSSVFGGASTRTDNYSKWPGMAVTHGASLGYRVPLGTRGRTELCPIVGGSFGDIGTTRDAAGRPERRRVARTRVASVGVSLGHRVVASESFAVIPSLGASVARSSFHVIEPDVNTWDTYGSMRVAVGLVLGTRFTVVPSVSVPIGVEGARRSLGVAFMLSLKPKRP